MANDTTSNSIELVKAILYDVDGGQHDISKAITAFYYYESIHNPFVTAVANIVDSGMNLIGTLPIQGGEQVYVQVKDYTGDTFDYSLHVWKVYGRTFTKSIQTYNLALISKEGLYNEGVRLSNQLKGTPDAIVSSILKDYLNTDKTITKETCKYNVVFYPNGKKAHSIIQAISQKAVSNTSSKASTSANKTTTGGKTDLSGDTKTSSGTAGYLFFENKDGFHFNSIDFYYSTGGDNFKGEAEVSTYEVRPARTDNRYTIEDYSYTNEVDILEQMRNGTYASHLVMYNWSTGYYEEYRYNLQENYDSMAHLGSQSKLGSVQTDLAVNPSRVMSVVVDHETWHDEDTPGSNEERDNPNGNGSSFPDYQKHWLGQSIARRYFMENQKLEIQVPGNMNLKVGDKIKVMLPNMASGTAREVEKYDRENSGTYLISALSHNNTFLNSSTCTSRLELIRDIYGMKDGTSNVK